MQTAQQYALDDEFGGYNLSNNNNLFETEESQEFVPQYDDE
jgi:hypothetical protein